MEESEKLTEDKKLASDILKEVADTNNNDSDKVTLFDIKTALHERGFGGNVQKSIRVKLRDCK